MQLSLQDRIEMRKFIREQLNNVSNQEKIHLDKDLLESLLFEVRTDLETKKVVKFPVWTGFFLEQIDLSEVSFDQVYWNFQDLSSSSSRFNNIKNILNLSFSKQIILENTNAKINFKKSYDFYIGNKKLKDINLSYVDLSDSEINTFTNFENVDISYTKAKIYDLDCAYSSSFEGVDLSQIVVNVIENGFPFQYTNFRDTALSIECKNFESKALIENFIFSLRKHLLDGCYVNGKRMKTEEEREKNKELILSEYRSYIEKVKKHVVGEISKVKNKTVK